MQGFTFDTICAIAFGHSPNAVESCFRGAKPEFLVAFDDLQQIGSERCFKPWWKITRFLQWGDEPRFTKATKIVDDYVGDIIRDRRSSGEYSAKGDLLSLYIQHARATNAPHLESTDYLRDVVVNFMIAGRDTTACTMTTMWRYFAENPRVVEKLRAEFSNVETPDWDAMRDSKYGQCVFNEALRMLPPVSVDFRIAQRDDVLPSGFIVKAGTRVGISNISIGRNPKYFEDPDAFKPERWFLNEDGTRVRVRPDEYMFPVFWAGPRLCLGKDMAAFEAKIVAYAVLTAPFDVVVQDGYDRAYQNGLVAFLKHGAPCKIVSR